MQAEAGPWGHLSPSPRSPTRTPAISPGAASTTSHLSPGTTSPTGPSPTSPAGSASGSRGPLPRQYRGRTSSMPAVPRHKVSQCFTIVNNYRLIKIYINIGNILEIYGISENYFSLFL